ncbi:hypothetical protein [uncultured Aquimarina sp.]|uniref:hypothetical protein n=1 Tax=uncultured Aquimarina sp. TaxID=575652 RepID=UPI002615F488|nr:hypothetical protein [uncultured Aquimarina sp.]
MLKSILKLEGVQKLKKDRLKSINGGRNSQDSICYGTGTTYTPNGNGISLACVNRFGNCTINGYRASCSGDNQGSFSYL